MATLQEIQQLANQLPGSIGSDILNRLNVLPDIINQAASRGVGTNQTPEQNRDLAQKRIGQSMDDFWTTIDVPLGRIDDQLQHLQNGLQRARSGLNNWDIAQTEQRIQDLQRAQQLVPQIRSMAGELANDIQTQSLAQFNQQSLPTQGGEVRPGTGEVSAGSTLGPSGPSANRLAPGGQMAQYDIINPQTGAVVGSTQDPTTAASQGFQVRLRDGTTGSGLPSVGGSVESGTGAVSQPGQQQGSLTADQILRAFSQGGSRTDIEAALRNIGWPDAGIKAALDSIQSGQNPTYAAPPGSTQPGTQQPTGQQSGTQQPTQPDPAPSAQPTATVPVGNRQAAEAIYERFRLGEITREQAINELTPLTGNNNLSTAQLIFDNQFPNGAVGGTGGTATTSAAGSTFLQNLAPGLDFTNLPASEMRPLQETAFGALSDQFNLSGMAPFLESTLRNRAQSAVPQFQLGTALGQFGQPGISGGQVQLGGQGLQDLASQFVNQQVQGLPTSESFINQLQAAGSALGGGGGQADAVRSALGITGAEGAQDAFGGMVSRFLSPRLSMLPQGIRGIVGAGLGSEVESMLGGRSSAEINPQQFIQDLIGRGMIF